MRLLLTPAAFVLLLPPLALARSTAAALQHTVQPDGVDGTALPQQQQQQQQQQLQPGSEHQDSSFGSSTWQRSSQMLVRRGKQNLQLSVAPDGNLEERPTSLDDGRTKVIRQEAPPKPGSLVSDLAGQMWSPANLLYVKVSVLVFLALVLIYLAHRHYLQKREAVQAVKKSKLRKSFLITSRMSHTSSRSLRRSASFDFLDVGGLAAASEASPLEATWTTSEDSEDSDCIEDEVMEIAGVSQRRGGVSAEATGAFNKKYSHVDEIVYEKTLAHKEAIMRAFEESPFFRSLSTESYEALADATEIVTHEAGTRIIVQGTTGRSCYVLLSGTVHCVKEEADEEGGSGDDDEVMKWRPTLSNRPESTLPLRSKTLRAGAVFGETTMLWQTRRWRTMMAAESCIVGKFKRDSYFRLVTDMEMATRSMQQTHLKNMALFETLDDEQIAKLTDIIKQETYEKGTQIIKQGEYSRDLYILISGECIAEGATGKDVKKLDIQEYCRYQPWDCFGEVAFLQGTPRMASVTSRSRVKVLRLSHRAFVRVLGNLSELNAQQYNRDPRKCIADFYRNGNDRGPYGALRDDSIPGSGVTEWFAVFRPTSRDAISKMLSGIAVGKSLNIKGKSSKMDRLSGFVPYIQINSNEDKQFLEESPPDAFVTVFYQSQTALECARRELELLLPTEAGLELKGDRALIMDNRYHGMFGIKCHERVMRELYLTRPDISPLRGWERGRPSEPSFMNMNLRATRGPSLPEVVLYQLDLNNPLNPHGLLLAYAEATVKPVVSDFDAFTTGSRGPINFDKMNREQQQVASWCIAQAEKILVNPSDKSWTSQWMALLHKAQDEGFRPDTPPFGFSDPTSYRLSAKVIEATKSTGAVRHGAECFNFLTPQELDSEYMVVWSGFDDKPWTYLDAKSLRAFLMQRIDEGFSFPIHPVWPLLDKEWYPVYKALKASPAARDNFLAWYPEESGIAEKTEAAYRKIHRV